MAGVSALAFRLAGGGFEPIAEIQLISPDFRVEFPADSAVNPSSSGQGARLGLQRAGRAHV